VERSMQSLIARSSTLYNSNAAPVRFSFPLRFLPARMCALRISLLLFGYPAVRLPC